MSRIKARNAEKAMTTLARFRAAQLAESGKGQQERRPVLASECDDLRKAEKWRNQIIREVTQKVAQIQNAGLGEFRMREVNDEINKLLREKGHWEVRIKELGGPDYSKIGPKMLDHEGKEVPGNRGYKYFGATKDLPGVRELFEQEPPKPPRKTRSELMKDIDADYYGYRDDDDGILIELEEQNDKIAKKEAYEKFKAKKFVDNINEQRHEEEDIYTTAEEPMSDDEDDEVGLRRLEKLKGDAEKFVAHVPIPSREEVEEALVKRKKAELLEQYTTEELRLEAEQSKTLLLK